MDFWRTDRSQISQQFIVLTRFKLPPFAERVEPFSDQRLPPTDKNVVQQFQGRQPIENERPMLFSGRTAARVALEAKDFKRNAEMSQTRYFVQISQAVVRQGQ